jgi:hypothetical protein
VQLPRRQPRQACGQLCFRSSIPNRFACVECCSRNMHAPRSAEGGRQSKRPEEVEKHVVLKLSRWAHWQSRYTIAHILPPHASSSAKGRRVVCNRVREYGG